MSLISTLYRRVRNNLPPLSDESEEEDGLALSGSLYHRLRSDLQSETELDPLLELFAILTMLAGQGPGMIPQRLQLPARKPAEDEKSARIDLRLRLRPYLAFYDGAQRLLLFINRGIQENIEPHLDELLAAIRHTCRPADYVRSTREGSRLFADWILRDSVGNSARLEDRRTLLEAARSLEQSRNDLVAGTFTRLAGFSQQLEGKNGSGAAAALADETIRTALYLAAMLYRQRPEDAGESGCPCGSGRSFQKCCLNA